MIIWQEILIIAFWALVITLLVKLIIWIFDQSALTSGKIFDYRPYQLNAALKRCYFLFPVENTCFNGVAFHRGMHIRVVTIQQVIIEGKFIGVNHDDLFCVVTNQQAIAENMYAVKEVHVLTEMNMQDIA